MCNDPKTPLGRWEGVVWETEWKFNCFSLSLGHFKPGQGSVTVLKTGGGLQGLPEPTKKRIVYKSKKKRDKFIMTKLNRDMSL